MNRNRIFNNPFILFSPFLILFIFYIIIFYNNGLHGDERKYLLLAQNLINGFYSPPPPGINLWYGPGYPLILVPFEFLNLPKCIILILNAIFHYLSIVMLFKTLIYFHSFRHSVSYCLLWALCFTAYTYLALIYTEELTIFLISLILSLSLLVSLLLVLISSLLLLSLSSLEFT